MKTENLDNVLIWSGNLAFFAAIYYAVFILGHSGWWFAFLLIFHFSPSKKESPDLLLNNKSIK